MTIGEAASFADDEIRLGLEDDALWRRCFARLAAAYDSQGNLLLLAQATRATQLALSGYRLLPDEAAGQPRPRADNEPTHSSALHDPAPHREVQFQCRDRRAKTRSRVRPQPKDHPMSNAQDYRSKSAEFARRASEATSLKDIKEFRQRANAFRSLAENEEWVTANKDKIVSNRAPADGRIGHAVAEDRS